jgi:hypothetical protein
MKPKIDWETTYDSKAESKNVKLLELVVNNYRTRRVITRIINRDTIDYGVVNPFFYKLDHTTDKSGNLKI